MKETKVEKLYKRVAGILRTLRSRIVIYETEEREECAVVKCKHQGQKYRVEIP